MTEVEHDVKGAGSAVGLVWSEKFLWHNPSGGAGTSTGQHWWIEPGDLNEESTLARSRLASLLVMSGLDRQLVRVEPRKATADQLMLVHTAEYVSFVEESSKTGGSDAGNGTPFGLHGYEVAALAAGGTCALVEGVCNGDLDRGYALVKPPGHHAGPKGGDGLCIFNNTAIGAAFAVRHLGLSRVAIIDWDAHHGNGTEDAFWTDPSVLTISLHQADWYPRGRGSRRDYGEGDGYGFNINIPVPPGSGFGAYSYALDRLVLPALRSYKPQLILVAAGYDSSVVDPGARLCLTATDYGALSRRISDLANELCGGRVVVVHEGGYSPVYVPFCGHAVIEGILGTPEPVVQDPFMRRFGEVAEFSLQDHQRAVIDSIVAEHPAYQGLAGIH